MKKKRLLFLLPLISSFVLTSCDFLNNLMPNGPIRRSSNENETSEAMNSTNGKSPKSSSTHRHSFGAWIVTVAPTCTEYGVEERKCQECDYIETRNVIPYGHDWYDVPESEDVNYIAPQVGAYGQRTQRCSRCGETQIVSLSPIESSLSFSLAALSQDTNGRVFINVSGYFEGYKYSTAPIKWAFGLRTVTDISVGISTGDFVVGSLNPSDNDYVYLADTINTDTGYFTISFAVNEIVAGLDLDGPYQIYLGPVGSYSRYEVDAIDATNYVDEIHRFYIRNDGALDHYLSICIDKLPPFHFSNAFISRLPVDDIPENDQLWVKIGGPARDQSMSEPSLLESLNQKTPFIQFQNTNNNYYQPENSSTRATAGMVYNYSAATIDGVLFAYLNINITFMSSLNRNTTYNTHLNILSYVQNNCVMDEDFLGNQVEMPNGKLIRAFANSTGKYNDVLGVSSININNNAYGNLGFRISQPPLYSWSYNAIETGLDADANSPTTMHWDDVNVSGLKFNSTGRGITLTIPREESLFFSSNMRLELLLSVRFINRQKTGFWRQGTTEKTEIIVNGSKMEAPETDLDFSLVTQSTANDGTGNYLSYPEWYDVGLDSFSTYYDEENTIRITYLGGGYSYYICGARIVS